MELKSLVVSCSLNNKFLNLKIKISKFCHKLTKEKKSRVGSNGKRVYLFEGAPSTIFHLRLAKLEIIPLTFTIMLQENHGVRPFQENGAVDLRD